MPGAFGDQGGCTTTVFEVRVEDGQPWVHVAKINIDSIGAIGFVAVQRGGCFVKPQFASCIDNDTFDLRVFSGPALDRQARSTGSAEVQYLPQALSSFLERGDIPHRD